MADLKKATEGVWFGNDFVPAGSVLPAGHPFAAHPAFHDYDPYPASDAPAADTEAELEALRTVAADKGVKVDKRWGADRLREEIAAAEGE